MTIWQPGMRCVCIHAPFSDFGVYPSLPLKGHVYTVNSASLEYNRTRMEDVLMLSLCEFPSIQVSENRRASVMFAAECFRPLSETRLDQFRAHLAPLPPRARAKEGAL